MVYFTVLVSPGFLFVVFLQAPGLYKLALLHCVAAAAVVLLSTWTSFDMLFSRLGSELQRPVVASSSPIIMSVAVHD